MSECHGREDYSDLPDAMKAARRWLAWKAVQIAPHPKPRKIPYYTTGEPRSGALDGAEDVARLASFDAAVTALLTGEYAGLGFALGPDGSGGCWQGIDLDDVHARPGLKFIADELPGYVERSPSGHGVHAIGYGRRFRTLGPNRTGIEAYSAARFFTVTGESMTFGEPVDLSEFVDKQLAPLHGQASDRWSQESARSTSSPEVSQQLLSDLRSALGSLDPDDYDTWIGAGLALKGLGPPGRDLWDGWAKASGKHDPTETERRWSGFRPERTGYAVVFAKAQAAGWINPRARRLPPAEICDELGPAPAFDPWEAHVGPRFPTSILPPVLEEYASYLSESTGADHSGCAVAVLTACSGALDQRMTLKMKRSGDWLARPLIWALLIGDPATMKSPMINAAIRPLRHIENEAVRSWQRDVGLRRAADKGERGDEPPPPTRFIANDATSEKMADLLSAQDRGILYANDEMSGWIGLMDKHGGGRGSSADRALWARAKEGGPHTVDRVGRGSIYVTNLAVGVLGGIQPDRLPEITRLASDGLLQRFLLVMLRRPKYPQEVASDGPAEGFESLISHLVSLKPAGLTMDEGGRRGAEEFQRFIFDLVDADAHGRTFLTWAGKLGGVHGALSLLLHLVEDPRGAVCEPVSERLVRTSTRLVKEFFIPHALEFYRSVGDEADWQSIQSIASFVLTSDRQRFRPSDFTNGVRALAGLGTWDLAKRISPLVAGGWLVEEYDGAMVRAWTVARGLREQFKARREFELRRKAEVIRSLRKLGHDGEDPK
jgi:hypothetical protein